MAVSDAGQAVASTLLLVAFLSGGFRLWHLYATTFLGAAFGIFQKPAFGASVTMLVPDCQRDRANAIRQINGPLGSLIAPAIIGAIYKWVGVTGAIAIDLATFCVAVAVVLTVRIPRPEKGAEGARMRGVAWSEMLGGVRYLWERSALFTFTLYTAAIMFLLGGLSALGTPYILARTGSATTLGILTSVTYAGGIAGGVVLSVWGGTRPRVHTIIPAIMAFGAFVVLNGTARTALVLGVFGFCGFAATPFILAPTQSLLQAKVAPDIQGRVFGAVDQLVTLITVGTYLVVGPLADRVFDPAVKQAGWAAFAPLVGRGSGAGIGLMYAIGGTLTILISLAVYVLPAIRHMEENLPDYALAEAVNA